MKYTEIEEGFIKGAEEFGIDRECIDAYLMEAQGAYDTFNEVINAAEAASGDPHYRLKLATDLISNNASPEVIKTAFEKIALGEDGQNPIMSLLEALKGVAGNMASSIGSSLQGTRPGVSSPEALAGSDQLGGGILGGGGGALIGLLLSRVLGINPMIGMLLAGALGGYAGHKGMQPGPAPFAGEPTEAGAGTNYNYNTNKSWGMADPTEEAAQPAPAAGATAIPGAATPAPMTRTTPQGAGQMVTKTNNTESIGNLPSPVSQMDKTPAPNIQANPGAPTGVSATTPKVEPLATPSAPVVNGQKSKLPGATETPALGTPPVQPPGVAKPGSK